MRLDRLGYASALGEVGPAAPRAVANRVEYRRDGVKEWYVNGPLGLEQGFDVRERPVAGRGPLTLSMRLSGPARRDGTGVLLGDTLRYDGLTAVDARGRTLPSSLRLRDGRLDIRVDDRGAAYPVRVDPLVEQAELTASDAAGGEALGADVAISGETIVASAPLHAFGDGNRLGAAYVFEKPASGWANATEVARLRLPGDPAEICLLYTSPSPRD